jgi:hypothetical protein
MRVPAAAPGSSAACGAGRPGPWPAPTTVGPFNVETAPESGSRSRMLSVRLSARFGPAFEVGGQSWGRGAGRALHGD